MTGRHFWTVLAGLFLGIAVADLYSLNYFFALAALLIAVALLLSPRSRYRLLFVVFFCTVGFGILRVNVAEYFAQSYLDQYVGERVRIEGVIVDEPDRRAQTIRLTIRPNIIVSATPSKNTEVKGMARMLVAVPMPAPFFYGDTVSVTGVLERPKMFETDNGRMFDYPEYLAARGIYYEVPFPKIEKMEEGDTSVRGVLFAIKSAYLSGLQNSLPEPYASLAGGITVGDKRSLGEKLSEQFRKTGLVHIVVLSGYNITLIAGLLLLLVRNASLRTRFIFGGGIILMFVLMTGASSTGVRAGAMAILALLAAASYRKYAISRALGATAAGMVLWNPHTLLYDPGFQLSVIATLGLIHLAPIIEKRCTWITEKLQLRAIFAATIGTQVSVLPLLLYQMGLFSLVSIPANLLVLPAIPAAMIASFMAGITASIYGVIGLVVGIPAYALLSYTIWMTELFASVPLGAVEISAFSGWWVVGVYVFFIALPWLLKNVLQQRPSSSS